MAEGIHVVMTGRAREISENKPTVLIFGPDHVLKEAAAIYRAKHPDLAVNLRNTDNVSMAQHEAMDVVRRILLFSPQSAAWESKFKEWGQDYTLGRVESGALVVHDPEQAKAEAEARINDLPPSERLTLQDGTVVDKSLAIAKAAANMTMSEEALSALDHDTLMTAIHSAYGQTFEPKKPAVAKKKKA